MTKKMRRKKKKKKKKKKKSGKGKRVSQNVATARVMGNEGFLLERVLSYLPWRVTRGRSHFKPSYAGVSPFMRSYAQLAGASDCQGFGWWFEMCCDDDGMFTFNATPQSEALFRRVVWKNFYNERYCDDIVEACRSVCFKSKRTSHQQIKSLRRSYTMLMLFSSDILTSETTNPVLASYAYHLVGQWMVKHVKSWSEEVHKKNFFVQLREVFHFWTKAQHLGCKASERAKRTVFDCYSAAVLTSHKEEDLKFKNFIG